METGTVLCGVSKGRTNVWSYISFFGFKNVLISGRHKRRKVVFYFHFAKGT